MKWICSNHNFDLSSKGKIMGILNVTPDSFSDGGEFTSILEATNRASEMILQGASIIDVGGESTRPGSDRVKEEEELNRVLPVIKSIIDKNPDACISIDTSKALVAYEAIKLGAKIINDVNGFKDPDMLSLAKKFDVGLVVMHMKGDPKIMQENPSYENVIYEIKEFFVNRYETLIGEGIDENRIVFDPGVGFGKNLDHNLLILKEIDNLITYDRPLLVGLSKKSFIGKLLNNDDLDIRNFPTVALTSYCREKGVLLHRVHQVRENFQSLKMSEAMINV